jgi:hypothetical protein
MCGENETHCLNCFQLVPICVIALGLLITTGCGWLLTKTLNFSGEADEQFAALLVSSFAEADLMANIAIFAREDCLHANAEQLGLPKSQAKLKISGFDLLVTDSATEEDSLLRSIKVDSVVIKYSADSIKESIDPGAIAATSRGPVIISGAFSVQGTLPPPPFRTLLGGTVAIPWSSFIQDSLLPRYFRIEYYRHSIDQGPEPREPQVYLPFPDITANVSIIATPLHFELTTVDDRPEPISCGPYAAYFHYGDSTVVLDSVAAITAEARSVLSLDQHETAKHQTPGGPPLAVGSFRHSCLVIVERNP